MNSKRQEIWVGTFLLVAMAVLVGVVLMVSGAMRGRGSTYRAYFKYAAGVGPGVPVRYGGLLAGKVQRVGVDPQNSTQIEVDFQVAGDVPVKTDSLAKITTLGPLGESYLELTTGTRDSPLAPNGTVLPSRETLAIAELGDIIAGLAPVAEQTLRTLNDRLGELKTTIVNVNDLLGDKNRQNISASFTNLNEMLAETRPKIAATLSNVQEASDKFPQLSKNMLAATERMAPLLEDLKGTVKDAREMLAHVDAMVLENRPDLRATMLDLRKTMDTASQAVELLRSTLDRNGDNLDQSLANVRAATDNLKEMTDSVKRKPSVLIRGETGKDRQPGATR